MLEHKTILAALRQRGCKLTRGRQAIIKILTQAAKPLRVRDILPLLAALGVRLNRATVYRELKFLQQVGLVKTLQLGQVVRYFEIARDDHHHLICTGCHAMMDIHLGEHLSRQERRISRQNRFKILSHALEFYGLCQKCA